MELRVSLKAILDHVITKDMELDGLFMFSQPSWMWLRRGLHRFFRKWQGKSKYIFFQLFHVFCLVDIQPWMDC